MNIAFLFFQSSLASSPSVRDLLKERGGTLEGLQLAGCSIISSAHLMSSIKVSLQKKMSWNFSAVSSNPAQIIQVFSLF